MHYYDYFIQPEHDRDHLSGRFSYFNKNSAKIDKEWPVLSHLKKTGQAD